MTVECRVTVNGQARVYGAGTTVADLVKGLGVAPERVAVELDRVIVRREAWGETVVGDGAVVEVVMFVGGG